MTTRASLNGTSAAEMEFEAAQYGNPYSNPEMEEEWEMHEGSPYSSLEMEEEWEAQEMHEGSKYSNPYSNPEWEEEWEAQETHEGSHYSNPYSNPEFENEAGPLMSLLARAAKAVVPQAKSMAMRVGGNLLGQIRQGQAATQPTNSRRNRQVAALFHRLGRLFAQAESETAAHEARLFGANEYETEVATHELAYEAALTEVMAAEASHTESESEAQALLGAAIPLSIRVMGGRMGVRRIAPTLVRVNAQLVLGLHRQGRPGRQLMRAVPAIQRRTLATLNAIQRTGRPITPALARQVMAGQATRVLGTPGICGRALVRNMAIRNRTVALAKPTSARASM
jgi:hypothetical protein